MTTQQVADGDAAARSDYVDAEARCHQLTGLSTREASISIGRWLNFYWDSILRCDPMLRAAVVPVRVCLPQTLKHCLIAFLNGEPQSADPRRLGRWAIHLLRQLAPILNWDVVLAYARFTDPTMAEQALAPETAPAL